MSEDRIKFDLNELSVQTAELYNMSIRLLPDGLTFTLSLASDGEVSYAAFLPAESGHQSYEAAIKELFFRHSMLCLPYKSVSVYYQPVCSVAIPEELYSQGRVAQWLDAVFDPATCNLSKGDLIDLIYPLKSEGKILAFYYYRDLVNFLKRTLLVVHAVPYFIPSLENIRIESRVTQGKKLCLYLRPERIDYLLVDQGKTVYTNSFILTSGALPAESIDEIIFYTFTLWRSLSLDSQVDSVKILYALLPEGAQETLELQSMAEQLQSLLEAYISQVSLQSYQAF
ncbi:DUF3822 family protein [Porphyromonas pogonae]|uniref:DUF3822 family protein n=1 Tax=Porphyromonas pogonae TaxID=867595 RepID=UPI002E7632C3|nr:DUF3822 family protein [Porphyromonas pogonae]